MSLAFVTATRPRTVTTLAGTRFGQLTPKTLPLPAPALVTGTGC